MGGVQKIFTTRRLIFFMSTLSYIDEQHVLSGAQIFLLCSL